MTKITHNLTVKIVSLMLLADLTESAGELLFKKAVLATGVDHVVVQNFFPFLLKLSTMPFLWLGLLIYLANFVFWMAVLSRLDLSIAFPIGNATYIIIPFLSMIALHEKISIVRWLGAACIIIGVTLISQSSKKDPLLS
ncbi:MAG: EamA family transporter [Candidatus Omnitrophica bacterium]|nr:EamA family transporter [Candidatus Omnitrophota bacterium]